MQRGTVQTIIKKDQPMGVLLFSKKRRSPFESAFDMYPSRRKAAIMDIPISMGEY
jgi:hypothetical protein